MDNTSISSWFRGFDIIVGLVLIVSSIMLFLGSMFTPATIVNMLILSVLLLGVSKLLSGVVTDEVSVEYRWVNGITGAAAILLALYTFFFPPVLTSTSIIILMVGLLLYGINSFVIGFAKGFSGSVRTLLIVAGIVSVVAALLGFADSSLATISAISFVAIALLVDGIEEITAGVAGHTAF